MKLLPGVTERGPMGPANVAIKGRTLAVVMLDERNNETNDRYAFTLDDLPKGAKPPSGKYAVSVSADGQYLQGMRPLNGAVTVKVKHFAHKEGQPPQFKEDKGTRTNRKSQTYTVNDLKFTVIGRILSEPYEELEVVLPILAKRKLNGFVEDDEGMLAIQGDSDAIRKTIMFMEATGVANTPIPFSDNPLPALEKAILNADREFLVVLQNGWPDSYAEIPQVKTKKSKPTKAKGKTKK